jgi:YD repeat-containing protein
LLTKLEVFFRGVHLQTFNATYNGKNQLTQIELIEGRDGQVFGRYSVSFTYDEMGRLAKEEEETGRIVEYFYDKQDRIIQTKIIFAGTGETLLTDVEYFEEDSFTVTQRNSVSAFKLDEHGNVIKRTQFGAHTTSRVFTYDNKRVPKYFNQFFGRFVDLDLPEEILPNWRQQVNNIKSNDIIGAFGIETRSEYVYNEHGFPVCRKVTTKEHPDDVLRGLKYFYEEIPVNNNSVQ